MNGQSLVLIAVGLFTSLVVTVAAVNHYQLEAHPASVASGLLWRVENALTSVQDLQADVSSTEFTDPSQPVHMTVRAIVTPVPALSVEYTAPDELSGQIVTVENDLLSHYVPKDGLLIVRRWSGLPLAAVGLAGLDVSRLRTQLEQGTITARVLDESTSLTATGLTSDLQVEPILAGATQSGSGAPAAALPASTAPALTDLGSPPAAGTSDPLDGTYIIEVRDAKSGDLTQALWIDRKTYFIQKVIYYEKDSRAREIEINQLRVNQGLTTEGILTLPQTATTIRG